MLLEREIVLQIKCIINVGKSLASIFKHTRMPTWVLVMPLDLNILYCGCNRWSYLLGKHIRPMRSDTDCRSMSTQNGNMAAPRNQHVSRVYQQGETMNIQVTRCILVLYLLRLFRCKKTTNGMVLLEIVINEVT